MDDISRIWNSESEFAFPNSYDFSNFWSGIRIVSDFPLSSCCCSQLSVSCCHLSWVTFSTAVKTTFNLAMITCRQCRRCSIIQRCLRSLTTRALCCKCRLLSYPLRWHHIDKGNRTQAKGRIMWRSGTMYYLHRLDGHCWASSVCHESHVNGWRLTNVT